MTEYIPHNFLFAGPVDYGPELGIFLLLIVVVPVMVIGGALYIMYRKARNKRVFWGLLCAFIFVILFYVCAWRTYTTLRHNKYEANAQVCAQKTGYNRNTYNFELDESAELRLLHSQYIDCLDNVNTGVFFIFPYSG